jgi:hypothetical protein
MGEGRLLDASDSLVADCFVRGEIDHALRAFGKSSSIPNQFLLASSDMKWNGAEWLMCDLR